MSLTNGTRLGPYEILAPIGAGGMGEVYKARDTRLDRIVAIKISKDQFSERFNREARAVAALNHPNISQLYDVGPDYLVMEFVEGVPVRPEDNPQKLLDLASQIAEGLTAAHTAGVVHRDLKPGNILVNRNGQVKILDFGLALMRPASHEAFDSGRTASATATGTTVGTTAYMSPEQARGETVDVRSDLWSLGVVLYEMATRVRPFDGSTPAVVFEALLSKAPVPVRERNPKVPPELEKIIGRLLEKDKALRYQSAADLAADLKRAGRGSADAVAPVQQPKPRVSKFVIAAGFAFLLFAGVAGLIYSMRPKGPVTSPSEYVQLTNFNDSAMSPNLSADGRMVTFIRNGEFCCRFEGHGQIWVKMLPNGDSKQLTLDAGPKYGPAFSPDGSRIAYTSDSWDTWTVPVLGGPPTMLLPNAFGLSWISDQRLLFSEIMSGTGLHMGVVTATEGRAEKREIYFPSHERAMAHFSHLSPDGKSVLLVEMDRTTDWQPCRLVPFDGSSAGKQVGPQGRCRSTAWSPDGSWMYFSVEVGSSSHLWRQKFPDGLPEQITFGPGEEEGVAVAPDGKSIITSVGTRRAAIWIHNTSGEHALSSEGYAFAPRLSRDGQRVFYLLRKDSSATTTELHSMDLASGKTENLLPGQSVRDYDISRDEKEVAFTTTAGDGESQVWLASFDRRAAPRLIIGGGYSVTFGDKDQLDFMMLEEKVNLLYRIRKDGSGRERIAETPVLNKFGISPDGNWLIAVSSAKGDAMPATFETVAMPVHGGAPRRICLGPCRVIWSADGRFFYLSIPAKTLVIPLSAGNSLPDLPASGINSPADIAKVQGSLVIDHNYIGPGPDPSTFVFTKIDLQRNLFQIPLH